MIVALPSLLPSRDRLDTRNGMRACLPHSGHAQQCPPCSPAPTHTPSLSLMSCSLQVENVWGGRYLNRSCIVIVGCLIFFLLVRVMVYGQSISKSTRGCSIFGHRFILTFYIGYCWCLIKLLGSSLIEKVLTDILELVSVGLRRGPGPVR